MAANPLPSVSRSARLGLRAMPSRPRGRASARTVVTCREEQVVGDFSLAVGQIDTLAAPDLIRYGMASAWVQGC